MKSGHRVRKGGAKGKRANKVCALRMCQFSHSERLHASAESKRQQEGCARPTHAQSAEHSYREALKGGTRKIQNGSGAAIVQTLQIDVENKPKKKKGKNNGGCGNRRWGCRYVMRRFGLSPGWRTWLFCCLVYAQVVCVCFGFCPSEAP